MLMPLVSGRGFTFTFTFTFTWPQQGLVPPPPPPPRRRVLLCGTEWSVSTCSADVPSSQHGKNHPRLCDREPTSTEVRGFSAPRSLCPPPPGEEKPITPFGFNFAGPGAPGGAGFISLFLFFDLFLLLHPQNSVALASIHFPLAGPPLSSPALQSVDNSTCKLQFIVFRNGKLFPCTGNSSNLADDGKRRSVSTPVAFTKLGKRKTIPFLWLF